MKRRCEFFEGCPMFKYFCTSAESLYRLAYCEGVYVICERRALRLAGKEVPVNLLPQGAKLWPDGTTPPKEFNMPGM